MRSITGTSRAFSPAKVNLSLKVVSRRSDGYHDLVSVVDLITLCDIVHFRELPEDVIVVADSKGVIPVGQDNTVFKAAKLMKEYFGVSRGIEIYVEKNIPAGAGLGGGSSNAATVIHELSRIWGVSTDIKELAELGSRVGADVPLFVHGSPCIMRGIGDRINPVQLPVLWYVLVYPNIVLSTKDIYSGLKIVLTKDENEVKVSGDFSTVVDIVDILENDLEVVALLRCPKIKTIKERLLRAGAVGSLMSGSGSTVFGIFQCREEAQEALGRVKDLGVVFTAKSV